MYSGALRKKSYKNEFSFVDGDKIVMFFVVSGENYCGAEDEKGASVPERRGGGCGYAG
jgi:hypothetical protein